MDHVDYSYINDFLDAYFRVDLAEESGSIEAYIIQVQRVGDGWQVQPHAGGRLRSLDYASIFKTVVPRRRRALK